PVAQEDVHAFQQTLGVEKVIHEELVDQDVHVVADIVVDGSLQIPPKEAPKQLTYRLVANLPTERWFRGSRNRLVVHGEGYAFVFIPAEGDGPDPCGMMLETECFDVDGEIDIHLQ